MKDGKTYEILWMGENPFVRGRGMAWSLAELLGGYNMVYPDSKDGMLDYDFCKNMLSHFDAIATDQEKIGEDWEAFFCADNWGKKILQYKNNSWVELKPGFSKENQK